MNATEVEFKASEIGRDFRLSCAREIQINIVADQIVNCITAIVPAPTPTDQREITRLRKLKKKV